MLFLVSLTHEKTLGMPFALQLKPRSKYCWLHDQDDDDRRKYNVLYEHRIMDISADFVLKRIRFS